MADTDRVHLIAEFAEPSSGDEYVAMFFEECVNLTVKGTIIRAEGHTSCMLEGAPNDVQAARDSFMTAAELINRKVVAYESNIEGKLTSLMSHLNRDTEQNWVY